jgi:hypothetical protein
MEFMIDTLNSYLILHKSISIPGLGTIYVERIPANSDFVNRQILPPGYQFRFDKYFDAPNKEFFAYFASQKQVPDFEAIRLYNEWAYELRNRLKTEGSVDWNGVGTLAQDETGDIRFHTEKSARSPLHPVAAERVVRTNAAHNMLVGDKETTTLAMSEMLTEETSRKSRWWIYALIIALIAAAILIYRFTRDGFIPEATGNSQHIGISN